MFQASKLLCIESQLNGKEIDRKKMRGQKRRQERKRQDKNEGDYSYHKIKIFMVLVAPLLEIVILTSMKHIEHWHSNGN